MDTNSKLNVIKSRQMYSKTYDYITTKEEIEFDTEGCEVCNIQGNLSGGAGAVKLIEAHELQKTDNENFDEPVNFKICHNCYYAIVNEDNSDLDH